MLPRRKATLFAALAMSIQLSGALAEAPARSRWEAKAIETGIPAMTRLAYRQLSVLHQFEGWQLNEWGTMIYDFGPPRPNPMTTLRKWE